MARIPSTANDQVKIVRMAFTSARKLGYITHNPAEAVEMMPEDAEPSKQPFDIDQVKAPSASCHRRLEEQNYGCALHRRSPARCGQYALGIRRFTKQVDYLPCGENETAHQAPDARGAL